MKSHIFLKSNDIKPVYIYETLIKCSQKFRFISIQLSNKTVSCYIKDTMSWKKHQKLRL